MTDQQNGHDEEDTPEVDLSAFTEAEQGALESLKQPLASIVASAVQRDDTGGSVIRVFRLTVTHIAASIGFWGARTFGDPAELENMGNMLMQDFKNGFEGGIAYAEKKEEGNDV